MARELSASEWQALPPDERERRTRHRAQREAEHRTVNDVDLANVLFDLHGRVHVRGRSAATPAEVESILDRSPMAHAIFDAIASARRVLG